MLMQLAVAGRPVTASGRRLQAPQGGRWALRDRPVAASAPPWGPERAGWAPLPGPLVRYWAVAAMEECEDCRGTSELECDSESDSAPSQMATASAASNRGSHVQRRAGRQPEKLATLLPFPRGSRALAVRRQWNCTSHSTTSIKLDRPAGTCRFHQDSATSPLMTLGPMPVDRSVDAGLMINLVRVHACFKLTCAPQ